MPTFPPMLFTSKRSDELGNSPAKELRTCRRTHSEIEIPAWILDFAGHSPTDVVAIGPAKSLWQMLELIRIRQRDRPLLSVTQRCTVAEGPEITPLTFAQGRHHVVVGLVLRWHRRFRANGGIAGLRRVRRRVIVGILETESDFHFARVPAGSQRLRGSVANGLRGTGSGGVIVISGARSTMSGSDSPFADDPPPPQHTGPTA